MKNLILLSILFLSSVVSAQEIDRPTKYYELADYNKIVNMKQGMTTNQVKALLKGNGEVDFPSIKIEMEEYGKTPNSVIYRQYVTYDNYGWTFSPANPADPTSPYIAAYINNYKGVGKFTVCFQGTMQQHSLGTAKMILEERSRTTIEIFSRRYYNLNPSKRIQGGLGGFGKGRPNTGGNL